jgi:glycosyltransferase involved in cell wall biosynthesis
MNYLFIHQNMPGQYKHIVTRLAKNKKNKVVFITKRKGVEIPNVVKALYKPRRTAQKTTHHYIGSFENSVLNGQQVVRVAQSLKKKGFTPHIVIGHPGWGEMLYIKDVFPDVPMLSFFEFYYRSHGANIGFDPEYPVSLNEMCQIRTANLVNMMSLESADAGVSPTYWQYQRYPPEFRYKLSVIFDGIDTRVCVPDPKAALDVGGGKVLTRADEVVTYAVRNLEPYRGFPTFMRAVELICKRRPKAHVVILGGDTVSYGRRLPGGRKYREKMLKEVTIDEDRVHFLGTLPYEKYLSVLRVSSAHVYLTYPFVLSWSMIEAMSSECLVIGSSTPPVLEVIEDRHNGLLVDFFSPEDVADRVDEVLDHPDQMREIRQRARQTVLERYDLEKCLARQMTLIKNLVMGHRPQPPAPDYKPGVPVMAPAKRIKRRPAAT